MLRCQLYHTCLLSLRSTFIVVHSTSFVHLIPGRIQGDVDSLFHYAPGESYSTFARTSFTPLFIEDVLKNMTAAKRAVATNMCGDNKECLFDFAVTGNLILYSTWLELTCSVINKLMLLLICPHFYDNAQYTYMKCQQRLYLIIIILQT